MMLTAMTLVALTATDAGAERISMRDAFEALVRL